MYRPAARRDARSWQELRNDPDALFWSGNRERIALTAHCEWYDRVLDHQSHRLVVHDDAGVVNAYGRIQIHRDAEVSLGVAPAARRAGLGRGMLKCLEEYAQNARIERLIGFVHPSNLPSMRAFARQGYYIDTNYRHYEKLIKVL